MTPASRVADAFPDDGDAFADAYLQTLLSRWCDIQATARRSAILLVVLAALFILLASSDQHASFTLGPLKLDDAAPVLVWVPMVISFVGLELLTLQFACWRFETLVQQVVRRAHPKVFATELHLAMAPPAMPVWGLPRWERLRETKGGSLNGLRTTLSALVGVFVIGAWIAFAIGAYRWVYVRHVDGTAFWISLSVTLFNVVRGGVLFADENDAGTLN